MFFGLHDQVRYRLELGFAFVDDGDRTRRINGMVFDKLRQGAYHTGDADMHTLVSACPTIFCQFDDLDQARRSFEGREL